MNQTYSLYRGATKTDPIADTIAAARDRYLARQSRPATEARVHSAAVDGLGTIRGLTVIGDDRVQAGEVWLTDEGRVA